EGQTVRTAQWTVYKDLDDETYSASGYAAGLAPHYEYTLVGPVSIQRSAHDGSVSQSIQAVRGCTKCQSPHVCGCGREDSESPGRLTAADCFPQSSYVRWSLTFTNRHGQQTASRQ